jgi:hypothetical protein
VFSVRAMAGRPTRCLSLYSPVPQWAQRRWDSLGESIDVHGAHLTYEIDADDEDDEAAFCSDVLWLERVARGEARERTGD